MRRIPVVGALLLAALLTAHLAPATAGDQPLGTEHREGRLIVKYRKGCSEFRKGLSRNRHGVERVRTYEELDMECVSTPPGWTAEEMIREYESDADVEYAEPDYVLRASLLPDDPQFSPLWGLTQIQMPAAWEFGTGSPEVVVAVIDSGIDYRHEDLRPNLWVNAAEQAGLPGVDDDGNGVVDDVHGFNAVDGSGDPMDEAGHGTHVAGTIGAAGNNGAGVAGMNWDVRIVGCRFMDASGAGMTSDAIACLRYVGDLRARGVDVFVANNSWGGGGYSRALRDAIQSLDLLFVAAAGNEGANNDRVPSYPSCYDLPNVLSVGASDERDGLAYFSNQGRRTVHVAAPGTNILSTTPGGVYASMSGTSMAAPHVAGLAALLKAGYPWMDWVAVKNLILAGGVPQPGLAGRTVTGRRIDALGSLSCSGSRVFSVLQVPSSLQAGVPATVSALSIECENPLGPVEAALPGGEVVALYDDGVAPDLAPGDGVFAGTWTPRSAAETLLLSSPAGSESVRVGLGAVQAPAVAGWSH